MNRYKGFRFAENVDEIIGYLKGKYKTIAEVKKCPKFKDLSKGDQDYIIDELKSENWK